MMDATQARGRGFVCDANALGEVCSQSGSAVSKRNLSASGRHVVDELIEERGERIIHHPLWPLIKPPLYRILHYGRAVTMADDIVGRSGIGVLDYLSDMLDLDVHTVMPEHIPRRGAFILAANHPTGIADGIAVYDALRPTRSDLTVFTNRDAIRVNPNLAEVLIPVEWRDQFRSPSKTKETLRQSARAFEDGRAIVIFPSGRIAYWAGGLRERPWQASAVALARKNKVPILPVHIDARNSGLFYFFATWNTELRDMTVFHELLNKRGKTFRLTFGRPIEPEKLEGDVGARTRQLQAFCEGRLRDDPLAEF